MGSYTVGSDMPKLRTAVSYTPKISADKIADIDFDDLQDVSVEAAANNETLRYSGGQWVNNSAVTSNGSTNLSLSAASGAAAFSIEAADGTSDARIDLIAAGATAARYFADTSASTFKHRVLASGWTKMWFEDGNTGNLLRLDSAGSTELWHSGSRWITSEAQGMVIAPDGVAVRWLVGSGTPEGVETAPVGSLFTRTDGGASTTLYVKESGTGNTGWVAK